MPHRKPERNPPSQLSKDRAKYMAYLKRNIDQDSLDFVKQKIKNHQLANRQIVVSELCKAHKNIKDQKDQKDKLKNKKSVKQ